MAFSQNPDVGYGRPPIHTRFKKGASGNPTGRLKGVKNLKTDLQEELAELISVRHGKREHQVTKQRLIIKGLVASAMSGDTKAAAAVFALCERVLEVGDGDDAQNELSPEEKEVIVRAVERQLKNREAPEERHEG
jgi:hypothetical protein